jgi:hypothetical protein
MSDVLKGMWIGFWLAAAFFFACIAEGSSIVSRFCGSLAGEDRG